MGMDGVDTMSKAELVILCEKHKLDGGKTVASMKYVLKKFFEEHDEPDAKKLKVDPSVLTAAASSSSIVSSSSGSGTTPVCSHGEMCPQLHSLTHRTAFRHGGEYRDAPIRCRDGMGCAVLRNRDHLKKYAHDDSLDKVCKHGAECPELHVYAHRVQFEHPGFRAQPVVCRDGVSCAQIRDKGHLYKYAHDVTVVAAPATTGFVAAATSSSISSSAFSAPPLVLPPSPAAAAVVLATPVKAVGSVADAGTAAAAPCPPAVVPTTTAEPSRLATPALTSPLTSGAFAGKALDDYPLESAVDAVLIALDKNSPEFWEVEEKFLANLQGRNDDYVANRIKKGKKPIRFVLIGAERVSNPVLEARFEIRKSLIVREREAGGDVKECRERVSFHGTHPKNIKSILKTGLLRFGHPLNPCKQQVDDGYFGSNRKGIYVSKYADYTLKYSNRLCAVEPADEVKTIMFRTMPGKSKHIAAVAKIDPTPGYDSHSSPTFLEWYLFDESQACPQYVLHIKAVEDTRTAADDE